MIGSKLAHYEITSHLGTGGMGEVYQATDTKLGRSVAIKFLPEAFSHDSERVTRFQREARVLASLNHPNIAAIHGAEEIDARHFLVMELVPGETLADRIKRGAVPIEEAVPIAKQIAEALEEAHEKGVVHRDLKPANIKVTADGKVKVLDFGLAKAFQETQVPYISNSPTLVSVASTPGVILGTAPYMSPEQAKGRPVDKRTDAFAFGCVLYEMLTGRRAFEGEDVQDILSRVLQREPDWSKLPSRLPPRVKEVLRRCLEKDTRNRLRDMGDLRLDLEHALKEPKEIAVSPEHQRGLRFAWVLMGLLGLLVVVLSVPATRYLRRQSIESPEMLLDINTPRTTQPLHFALSPDGMRLVFVARGNESQQLWLRPLNAATAQPLAGTEGGEYPFWSPDSQSIGFFAGSKLKRLDIGAGLPQELADAPAGRGATWNSEGTILFAQTNASALWRVPASGGSLVQVTKLDLPRQGSHRFPQFLPDGHHFVFFIQGTHDTQGIYLASLDGGEAKRLVAADATTGAGAYIDPGFLLFNRQGSLVARRLDISNGTLTGDTMTLAESVSYDLSLNLAGFAVSSAGRVAYRAGGLEARQLQWFDRNGKLLGVAGEPDVNTLAGAELSPNGRQVGVSRTIQGNTDVWLIDILRGGSARFTVDQAVDQAPIWSPDGTKIAFCSNRSGSYDLYQKLSSGDGSEELLVHSPQSKIVEDWSADGKFLLYQEAGESKTSFDLWALPTGGDRKPIPVVNSPFEERDGQFSPDVHWVAYQSNVTGRFEIYVQPFPGPGGPRPVSTAGGTSPRWRADGKELFFIAANGKLMSVPVNTLGTTFEAGPPVALFQTRIVTGGFAALQTQYAVSRDRFLINTQVDESNPITLILNWKPKP